MQSFTQSPLCLSRAATATLRGHGKGPRITSRSRAQKHFKQFEMRRFRQSSAQGELANTL